MKRILINVLSLAVVVLGSAQLSAQEEEIGEETNYQTCMRECRADGHSFIFCHGLCKELADTESSAQ